jgi:hypothetical protein
LLDGFEIKGHIALQNFAGKGLIESILKVLTKISLVFSLHRPALKSFIDFRKGSLKESRKNLKIQKMDLRPYFYTDQKFMG